MASSRTSIRAIAALRTPFGRIYQQTFIDTYTKVAFAKLYKARHRSHRPICSTTA
jgi:hypothetical protein